MKKSILCIILVLIGMIAMVNAEMCPTIIGWKVKDNVCLLDSGCDYDTSGKTKYYPTEEDCLSSLQLCPNIIGWKIVDNKCISDSGCDYDTSGKTKYYPTEEDCLSSLQLCPTIIGWRIVDNNFPTDYIRA
jgi:hypothetical protein